MMQFENILEGCFALLYEFMNICHQEEEDKEEWERREQETFGLDVVN